MDNVNTLHVNWSSSTYPKMHGNCEFYIPVGTQFTDEQPVQITVMFQYAEDSSFRAGKKKYFTISCARSNSSAYTRIVAQTPIGFEQQLQFTFSFEKTSVIGYYSSIIPIDCGALKPLESKLRWHEIFS